MQLNTISFALLLSLGLACKPTAGDDPRVGNTPPAVASAAQRPGSVWWVTATFEPSGSAIGGISVREIDTTWAAALALDYSILPPEAAEDPSGLADSSVRLRLDGDFNRDGTPDQAIVGVYSTHAGETGRFFLILTTRDGQPAVAQLGQLPGPPGFSGVLQRGDHLLWAECMECDSFWEFAWDGEQYAVLSSTPEED